MHELRGKALQSRICIEALREMMILEAASEVVMGYIAVLLVKK